ncbi:hypothetical protein CC78DRAFT_574994 [Lojkania enalia]|uniref:Uncharacterized protein n=1 Tax=Lojkania enalia TaxID=147567 RepID=A0A9P4NA60_9PLEO|nr:hypothetical protein CC78DRAFT_574994 [Didymosphaeria enalia]
MATYSSKSSYLNFTTPGNISITALSSATSVQTKINIAAVSLMPPIRASSPGFTYPAEFIRFAILRSSLGSSDTTEMEEYESSLEITECILALTAYNYSNANASGTQFSINSN